MRKTQTEKTLNNDKPSLYTIFSKVKSEFEGEEEKSIMEESR